MTKEQIELAKRAIAKGAIVEVMSNTDSQLWLRVYAWGRIAGNFVFDSNKNLIKSEIIERDYYPLELALYKISEKKRGRPSKK